MTERKEWRGIELNECRFMGKVTEDPSFAGSGVGEFAFVNLRTSIAELSEGGQWNNVDVIVPLMTSESSKVNTIRNYVQAGRELLVDGYYKSWVDENGATGHRFVITRLKLGSKPYVPKDESNGGIPPMPQ